jgi:hypothetical protein
VHRGTTVSATTLNVSEDGCAVKVRGLRPEVGDEISLCVTGGPFQATAQAVVRWTAPRGRADRTVGMRVLPGARDGGWQALVAGVVRAGACAPDRGEASGEDVPRARRSRR